MENQIPNKFLLAVSLAILASLSLIANAQTPENPGLEDGTLGWVNWGRFSTTSDAYTGNAAARANATGGFGSATLIEITPGEEYQLSAYAKTTGAPSFAGIGLHLFNANNDQVGQDFVNISSSSYTLFSKNITIPSNVVRVRVWGWVEGSGGLTVDDIELNALTSDPQQPAGPADYFVDVNGDDRNTGLQGQPWRTLERVNAQDLGPGDVIHLTSGQTFAGMLELTSVDTGNSGAPVKIQSTAEEPAIIQAGSGSAVILDAVTDVVVDNLVLIGDGRNDGNRADGLLISNSERVSISYIDVFGFQHSGVYSYNSSDVNLTYINAQNNGYAGIHGFSEGRGIGNRSRNLYIGYSRAINNPGDPTVTDNHSGNGIVVGNVDNVTIEYCFAEGNGWDMPRIGNGPVGIWIWQSDNSLLQYNIARRNRTPSGASDGGGFDFDGGVTNSIMQYNISYENAGPGYGLFQFAGASPWYNNIIRYNISENDGTQNPGGISIWSASSSDAMSDAYIYNNVVYNTIGPAVAYSNNWHSNFNFSNNIFVYRSSGIQGNFDSSRSNFIGNLWHDINGGFNLAGYGSLQSFANGTGQEFYNGGIVGVSGSPQFADASASQITDPTLIPEYLKYRLNSGSPAINAGVDVTTLFGLSTTTVDLYGNEALFGSAVDMGVHEFPNVQELPDEPESPSGECNPNADGVNLLINPSFESRATGYFIWGNASVVSRDAYEGSSAFHAVGANAGAIQTVTNLTPNTTYYLSGWGNTSESTANNQLMLGVKNFSTNDGSDQIEIRFTSANYTCEYLTFTTGGANTSAEIFAYQWQGAGNGNADALKLTSAGGSAGGAGTPLNILPLGDSITQSGEASMGYRYYLWKNLIDDGYNFDLIGSETGPWLQSGGIPPEYPLYQGQAFDQDNEGHAGWSTQNIAEGHPDWGFPEGLADWVENYTADVVLLHIGTNDVWYHSWPPNAVQSANKALAYVENIIDILQADNPNVTIFLAQIIPYASWYEYTYSSGGRSYSYDFTSFVNSFNAAIPAVALRKSTASSDIVVVDHFTGFDDTLIRDDGIHPNDAGERFMAQRWIDALNAYFGD